MNAKSSNAEGGWGATAERTSRTDDQRIEAVTPLPPPEHLIRFFPIAGTPVERLIGQTRDKVRRIMQRKDDRLLVIMGPCSIHEPAAALEYARKLLEQRHRHADTLEIVMRVYFEKPRTTVGWKGAFTVRIRPSRTRRARLIERRQTGRDQSKDTGYFFINVGNYADSGERAVEDGKLCTKPQKSKAACNEMRLSAGSLLLKRDNGQLVEFVAK